MICRPPPPPPPPLSSSPETKFSFFLQWSWGLLVLLYTNNPIICILCFVSTETEVLPTFYFFKSMRVYHSKFSTSAIEHDFYDLVNMISICNCVWYYFFLFELLLFFLLIIMRTACSHWVFRFFKLVTPGHISVF